MSSTSEPKTAGARLLADVEKDDSLLHILSSLNFTRALDELLSVTTVFDGIVLLGDWALDYPAATGELLRRVARDSNAALKLTPVILGCVAVKDGPLSEEGDEILAAAFPELKSPWRDAAADREGVRELLNLSEGEGYDAIPPPDSSWQWPSDKPFPPPDSIAGAQARLNYVGLGCGPVNGEWNGATRRATTRWQIERGLTPTGELDDATIDQFEHYIPAHPEGQH